MARGIGVPGMTPEGKKTETLYIHGEMHGIAIEYHESAGKRAELPFVNRQSHGLERRWDEAGQLIDETRWKYVEEVV
jgi:antitoxin component YwqK of YwqJK toxin-antitoxin module